jgi:hypothetical protein
VSKEGAPLLRNDEQCSPETKLSSYFHAVGESPVLRDTPVLKATDDNAGENYRPASVGTLKGPMRGDPIAFGHLLLSRKAQIAENSLIQADGFTDSLMPAVLHRVDVIYEVGRVTALKVIELPSGANFLDRIASGLGFSLSHWGIISGNETAP